MTNKKMYEMENKNFSSDIKNYSPAEIEEIKTEYSNNLKNFNDIEELYYFLAVDWEATITLIKYIVMSL